MVNEQLSLKPNEIRSVLRNWVTDKFQLKHDDILIDELGFSNRSVSSTIDQTFRADLALANGRLAAFEIKSGADSLKRWDTQMNGYLNVFDEVWLCCHGKHLQKALEVTNKAIGILLIDDLGGVAVVRYAKNNHLVNIYDLSGLLWREEINEFCKKFDIAITSRMTKREIRNVMAEQACLESLKKFVLARIKYRKGSDYSSLSSSWLVKPNV